MDSVRSRLTQPLKSHGWTPLGTSYSNDNVNLHHKGRTWGLPESTAQHSERRSAHQLLSQGFWIPFPAVHPCLSPFPAKRKREPWAEHAATPRYCSSLLFAGFPWSNVHRSSCQQLTLLTGTGSCHKKYEPGLGADKASSARGSTQR